LLLLQLLRLLFNLLLLQALLMCCLHRTCAGARAQHSCDERAHGRTNRTIFTFCTAACYVAKAALPATGWAVLTGSRHVTSSSSICWWPQCGFSKHPSFLISRSMQLLLLLLLVVLLLPLLPQALCSSFTLLQVYRRLLLLYIQMLL
jgi:hypothetical protein